MLDPVSVFTLYLYRKVLLRRGKLIDGLRSCNCPDMNRLWDYKNCKGKSAAVIFFMRASYEKPCLFICGEQSTAVIGVFVFATYTRVVI